MPPLGDDLGQRTRCATLERMAESESSAGNAPERICSLPIVGATTVEDAVFYTLSGALAVVGLVSWPTAALISTAHALHQRARNVTREGTVGEVRAGLLEATDEIL
jgi:hypothetical protein